MAHDPGMFITFIAWMRERGAGYQHVFSPQFDHWDGCRVLVPEGTQWQECDQVPKLEDYNQAEIAIEGVTLDPCPFCKRIPRLVGNNRNHNGVWVGAPPHRFNNWWLECCQWANSPRGKASWLLKERAAIIDRHCPTAALHEALVAQEEADALSEHLNELWAQRAVDSAEGFVAPELDSVITRLTGDLRALNEKARELRKAALAPTTEV